MKKLGSRYVFCMVLLGLVLVTGHAGAFEVTLAGKPLQILGYITQNASFAANSKSYPDFERDLNGALTNVLLETAYAPTENTKLFVSGMFSMDWAYDIKSHSNSWRDKGFADSRRYLYMDNKDWQLLKEAHLTWTPDNWFIRAGKQVVIWGEMDGFRIMDQINPLDSRRGFADVEFETSRIPIWLIRAGYNQENRPEWLQELGYEFVFNPNVEFIRNQGINPGNDVGGIWAPYMVAGANTRLGSWNRDIEPVRSFSSEGFEYAAKIRAVVWDSILTLNWYYGLDKDPVTRTAPGVTITKADDGANLVHSNYTGKYPLFRFIGGTFSKDINPLKAGFLGGVSPVLRLEALYAFDSTFTNSLNQYEKHDEIRWGAGVDWKIKIPVLNPRAYFSISPQFYHRKILDYPRYAGSADGLRGVYKDNYQYTLLVSTSYYHNKIAPSFFWQHDDSNMSDLLRFQVVYEQSSDWRFTAGAIKVDGSRNGAGLEPFQHKDYVYFKVSRKFN